jgi:ribonucleotide reductase alpha subunit
MLSKNAIGLLEQRYCKGGEEPINVFRRTANTLGTDDKTREELFYLMSRGYFLPNSPALYNSSYSNMFHACCALGVEDNMEYINDDVQIRSWGRS